MALIPLNYQTTFIRITLHLSLISVNISVKNKVENETGEIDSVGLWGLGKTTGDFLARPPTNLMHVKTLVSNNRDDKQAKIIKKIKELIPTNSNII